MACLIQPRDTFRPTCLGIDFGLLKSFLPGKEEVMTSITKLQVKIYTDDLEELSIALEHCRSLSFISLHMLDHDLIGIMHPVLPTTVSNLSIYFQSLEDVHESFRMDSVVLVPMLRRYPHLKEITVYAGASALGMAYDAFIDEPYLETGWNLYEPLPFYDTQVYCEENKMGFNLILVEYTPRFLDHTYDSSHILVDPSRPDLLVRAADGIDEVDDEEDEDEDEGSVDIILY